MPVGELAAVDEFRAHGEPLRPVDLRKINSPEPGGVAFDHVLLLRLGVLQEHLPVQLHPHRLRDAHVGVHPHQVVRVGPVVDGRGEKADEGAHGRAEIGAFRPFPPEKDGVVEPDVDPPEGAVVEPVARKGRSGAPVVVPQPGNESGRAEMPRVPQKAGEPERGGGGDLDHVEGAGVAAEEDPVLAGPPSQVVPAREQFHVAEPGLGVGAGQSDAGIAARAAEELRLEVGGEVARRTEGVDGTEVKVGVPVETVPVLVGEERLHPAGGPPQPVIGHEGFSLVGRRPGERGGVEGFEPDSPLGVAELPLQFGDHGIPCSPGGSGALPRLGREPGDDGTRERPLVGHVGPDEAGCVELVEVEVDRVVVAVDVHPCMDSRAEQKQQQGGQMPSDFHETPLARYGRLRFPEDLTIFEAGRHRFHGVAAFGGTTGIQGGPDRWRNDAEPWG